MKLAICYDECGSEAVLQVSKLATREDIESNYPEYHFRFWEEYDPDKYHQESGGHYDPETDSYV